MGSSPYNFANLWCAAIIAHRASHEDEKASAEAALNGGDAALFGSRFKLNRGLVKEAAQEKWRSLGENLGKNRELENCTEPNCTFEIALRVDHVLLKSGENAYSGASKLLWFLKDMRFASNWTMFDRLASAGLGSRPEVVPRVARSWFNDHLREAKLDPADVKGTRRSFLRFYALLDQLELLSTVTWISKVFEETDYYAARVVDKALMTIGKADSYKKLKAISDGGSSEEDRKLANAITEATKGDLLVQHLRNKWALE